MAELILTDQEKASANWRNLDDASLGKLVKRQISFLETTAEEMDQIILLSAALMLCCSTAKRNADTNVMAIDGVTEAGEPLGDWTVTIQRQNK